MDGLRSTPKSSHPPQIPRKAPLLVTPTPQPPRAEPVVMAARRPRLSRRTWLWAFFISLFLALCFAGFFLFKIAITAQHIQINNKGALSLLSQFGGLAYELGSQDFDALKKTDEGRINILLLGRAGEKYPGRNLTDTIMLMSIDLEKRKVALLSIPRDLFVSLPEAGISGKINSFYQYGLSENLGASPIRQAVETITNQPVHYFFVLDFDGFEKVINAIGGIEVDVVKDFYDPRYPGKNYSYETFELKKGWQTLDGATALKYVRERHDDPEGDFGRAKRQQQVITAVRNKAFSTEVFLHFDRVNDLFTALGESVQTDATLPELENLFALSKKIDTRNIESSVIDAWKKESLLRVSHLELGGVRAFVLVPRVGNWSEIQERSANIFNQEAVAERQRAVREENPRITIVSRPQDSRAARELDTRIEEVFGKRATLENLSDTLEVWPKESIIVDKTNLAKPWSVDTLLKKFALEKQSEHPLLRFSSQEETSDIIIILGQDLARSVPEEQFKANDDLLDDPSAEPLIIQK